MKRGVRGAEARGARARGRAGRRRRGALRLWPRWTADQEIVRRLDDRVRELDPLAATEVIGPQALEVARELAGARPAELVLFRGGVGWHLRHRGDELDPGWHPLSEPLPLARFHPDLADGSAAPAAAADHPADVELGTTTAWPDRATAG